eukprot:gnl/TRDRNA2_/TRDRNA2_168579_c1_seq1.p1 gnl/TRDRNA2_/TRDRNA2_168579_c1~~gnl/TRDRNA2_/TRDRNA2_168579_c1_seq1.p1  ORF type:complete len:338 (+),score=60.84 gnl/TRDRNA2_/TRDRNA2_168579_c1_seq1:72-1085(+)
MSKLQLDDPRKRLQIAALEDIAADLHGLVDNEQLGDVQFVFCDGPPIHASKALLAARCTHFRNLFFGPGAGMQEGTRSFVDIKDCPREAFLGLLHLLHTGAVAIEDPVLLVEIHRLLDCYNLEQLADALKQTIVDTVTDATVLGAAEAAQRCGQLALRDRIVEKIGPHMCSAICDDKVQTLSRELLVSILRCTMQHRRMDPRNFSSMFLAREGTMDASIEISGRRAGWHGAILSVPDHRKFSVKGVSVGEQVGMWVCKLGADADNSLRIAMRSPKKTCWNDGSRFHLTFESEPRPHAKLLVNGGMVHDQYFDSSCNAEYRPVLFCGDSHGLRDLIVE